MIIIQHLRFNIYLCAVSLICLIFVLSSTAFCNMDENDLSFLSGGLRVIASPNGDSVVFIHMGSAFLLNLETNEVRPVQALDFMMETDVAWSPDGSKLAFIEYNFKSVPMYMDEVGEANAPDVFLSVWDGKYIKRLFNNPYPKGGISWNCTNNLIAFTQFDAKQMLDNAAGMSDIPSMYLLLNQNMSTNVLVIDASSGELIFSTHDGSSSNPKLSPDCSKLLYVNGSNDIESASTVNLYSFTSQEQEVLPLKGDSFEWAIDSQNIVFMKQQAMSSFELWKYSIDDKKEVRIADSVESDGPELMFMSVLAKNNFGQKVHPDTGDIIFLCLDYKKTPQICRIDKYFSNLKIITNYDMLFQYPQWSGGMGIVASGVDEDGYGIFAVDDTTGSIIRLISFGNIENDIDRFRPASPIIDFSPGSVTSLERSEFFKANYKWDIVNSGIDYNGLLISGDFGYAVLASQNYGNANDGGGIDYYDLLFSEDVDVAALASQSNDKAGDNECLMATAISFSLGDGSILWSKEIPLIKIPPTNNLVDSDKGFYVNGRNKVLFVSKNDGSIINEFSIEGSFEIETLLGTKHYLSMDIGNQGITVIRKNDFKPVGVIDVETEFNSLALFENEEMPVIVLYNAKEQALKAYSFDDSRRYLWTKRLPADIYNWRYDDSLLYFTLKDGTVEAVDMLTGTLKWTNSDEKELLRYSQESPVQIGNGNEFTFTTDDYFVVTGYGNNPNLKPSELSGYPTFIFMAFHKNRGTLAWKSYYDIIDNNLAPRYIGLYTIDGNEYLSVIQDYEIKFLDIASGRFINASETPHAHGTKLVKAFYIYANVIPNKDALYMTINYEYTDQQDNVANKSVITKLIMSKE